jgi:hypothetical protein
MTLQVEKVAKLIRGGKNAAPPTRISPAPRSGRVARVHVEEENQTDPNTLTD